MTALTLSKPLATELGDLIARVDLLLTAGDVFTPEEMRDLMEWLKAARQKHWDELREQRSANWQASIVRFERRQEGKLPARFCEAVRPTELLGEDVTPCA